MLTVGSLCTGVGGIDLGFEQAGMLVTTQVEWDSKCQGVLRRHWPETDIYGDLKEFHAERGAYDVVVGGTPCQDLSVAGARAGLDGERSSLFFDFARVISEAQPEWIVWENVAGALSSSSGRDMGIVLATLADLGYGLAYRVLDARFFGVPQRRRRVIVVGRRRDLRGPAEVLALGESLPRHLAPSAASRPVVTRAAEDGSRSVVWPTTTTTTTTALAAADRFGADDNIAQGGKLLVTAPIADASSTLQGGGDRGYRVDAEGAAGGQVLVTFRKSARVSTAPRDFETWVNDGRANTLNTFDIGDIRTTHVVVFDTKAAAVTWWSTDVAPTLRAMNYDGSHTNGGGQLGVVTPLSLGARRLTPREDERLQGFPDDWTRFDADGIEIADSHRYRMMGNSVAVPVFQWVGSRIRAVAEGTALTEASA